MILAAHFFSLSSGSRVRFPGRVFIVKNIYFDGSGREIIDNNSYDYGSGHELVDE